MSLIVVAYGVLNLKTKEMKIYKTLASANKNCLTKYPFKKDKNKRLVPLWANDKDLNVEPSTKKAS